MGELVPSTIHVQCKGLLLILGLNYSIADPIVGLFLCFYLLGVEFYGKAPL